MRACSWERETHVDDLGVSRSAILNLWICLAQDTDKWWPVFNTVMNLAFYKMWEIYLTC